MTLRGAVHHIQSMSADAIENAAAIREAADPNPNALVLRPDANKFADAIEAGCTIREAMLRAGYSEGTAAMGVQGLSQAMKNVLAQRHIKSGMQYTPEDRARLVRGRLIENAIEGQDRATRSLELLGKDKDVALWQSDAQVGAIVVGVIVNEADKGNAAGHSTIIDAEDLEPNQ